MKNARLGRDIAIAIGLKLIALAGLYFLCFAPAHRPAINVAAHISGPPAEQR